MATMVSLAFEVARKLNALGEASSDNVQWTMSQLEVEYLTLRLAIENAQSDEAALPALRQRFDIFYSRTATLEEGSLYAPLRQDPDFAAGLVRLRAYLDDAVALIDLPDDALTASLATLEGITVPVADAVRTLAVRSLETFSIVADQQRESVARTLFLLAVTTLGLILVLTALAMMMAHLLRQSDRRARSERRMAQRMAAIIGTSLDAVVVADAEGRILEFNGAAERLFGWSADEILGRGLEETIIPEEARRAHVAGMTRLKRGGGSATMVGAGRIEVQALRRNGETFPAEISINKASNADGDIFVAYMRDITADKQAEADLIDARDRALAGEKSKAQFLAVMSHEMRTPMNGLLGTLSLLSDSSLTDRQRTYVDAMQTSGELLLHHVNDVLDISKFESGRVRLRPVNFNVTSLLEDLLNSQREAAAARGNTLRLTWAGRRQDGVRGDRERLRHVLLNLIGNAIKFTRNGTVSVEAELLPGKDGAMSMEFRVADTGVGIGDADLERIFEDFETVDTSYGRTSSGTGLGLGIARRLTELLGGEIGAESILGEGSLFWCRIPLQPARAPMEAAAVEVPDAAPLTLLIVEDNEINRTVLSEMLTADGHSVDVAHDGAEGVRRAEDRRYDAILMDVSMPVMDGVTAARMIRSGDGASRDSRLIAVTAHAMPSEREGFRAAGIEGFVSKPIDRAALKRALRGQDGTAGNTGAPSVPLVDATQVAELRDTLGAETASELLGRFMSEADALMGRLPLNGAAPPADLQMKIHHLASSAAIIGAEDFRHHLHEIETRLKTGETAQLNRHLEQLMRKWLRTRPALTTAYRAEPSAA